MRSGCQQVMWGLFLSIFHINIGAFQILPAFVGWLIITHGVEEIMKEYSLKAFTKAHLYAGLLTVETILSFVLNFLAINNEYIHLLTLFYMVFNLLFIYYFMEGSLEYLRINEKHSEAEHYKGIQLCYIILCVVISIIGVISLAFGSVGWNTVAGAVGLILVISLMITIKNIKNIDVEQQGIEEKET